MEKSCISLTENLDIKPWELSTVQMDFTHVSSRITTVAAQSLPWEIFLKVSIRCPEKYKMFTERKAGCRICTWLTTVFAILRKSFFKCDRCTRLEGLLAFLVLVVANTTDRPSPASTATVFLFASPEHPSPPTPSSSSSNLRQQLFLVSEAP